MPAVPGTRVGIRHLERRRRRGIHITAIDEHPSWIDPEIARFFGDARGILGCSQETLARALGTTPGTIANLEQGRLRALPHGPELERIVVAYGRLVRVDMAVALVRIRQQVQGIDPLAGSRLEGRRRQVRTRRHGSRSARLAVVCTMVVVGILGSTSMMADGGMETLAAGVVEVLRKPFEP